jgi:hypothetical protein
MQPTLIFSVTELRRGENSYEADVHGNKSGKLMMGRTGSSNVNIKNAYRILLGKTLGKLPFGTPTRRWGLIRRWAF